MAEATINDTLSLTYPEGFHEMEESELTQFFASDFPNRWGIRDRERHIAVAVIWNEAGAISAALASAKDANKGIATRMRRAASNTSYRFDGFFAITVAGKKAHGFRYAYEVQGIRQVGEAITLKHGRCFYTIYYYAREDQAAESHPVFDGIVESATLA